MLASPSLQDYWRRKLLLFVKMLCYRWILFHSELAMLENIKRRKWKKTRSEKKITLELTETTGKGHQNYLLVIKQITSLIEEIPVNNWFLVVNCGPFSSSPSKIGWVNSLRSGMLSLRKILMYTTASTDMKVATCTRIQRKYNLDS